MVDNDDNLFGEVIHSYSRAQAIEDGVLVDLSAGDLASLVSEAGFTVPIAVTAEVWQSCFLLTDAAKRAGNDLKGRAWDVLFMLRFALRSAKRGSSQVIYELAVVRDSVRPSRTQLKAICGPGDNGEPVITIMFPHQD